MTVFAWKDLQSEMRVENMHGFFNHTMFIIHKNCLEC